MTVENADSGPTAPIDVFREVVNSRRSVRKFDETPLPDDVIRDCLELAMRAPNSSNLQPGNFMWSARKSFANQWYPRVLAKTRHVLPKR